MRVHNACLYYILYHLSWKDCFLSVQRLLLVDETVNVLSLEVHSLTHVCCFMFII